MHSTKWNNVPLTDALKRLDVVEFPDFAAAIGFSPNATIERLLRLKR